jgi:hypothetical protein
LSKFGPQANDHTTAVPWACGSSRILVSRRLSKLFAAALGLHDLPGESTGAQTRISVLATFAHASHPPAKVSRRSRVAARRAALRRRTTRERRLARCGRCWCWRTRHRAEAVTRTETSSSSVLTLLDAAGRRCGSRPALISPMNDRSQSRASSIDGIGRGLPGSIR